MAWVDDFKRRLHGTRSVVYVLHLNTGDLVCDGGEYVTLSVWLDRELTSRCARVHYDLSAGLRCTDRHDLVRLLELTGFSDLSPEQVQELQKQGVAIPEPQLPRDPKTAFPFLELAMERSVGRGGMGVVLQFGETLFPEGDFGSLNTQDRSAVVALRRWSADPVLAASGTKVVVIADNLTAIHSSLRADGSLIQAVGVPLPGFLARLAFICHLVEHGELDLALDAENAAHLMAGLRLKDIRLMAELARARGESLGSEPIKAWKKERLESEFEGLLEVLEPGFGLDSIGGLDSVKAYFREIIKSVAQQEVSLVPLGITLMGPPGTGKTALVEALSRECGFGFVRLHNVREKWVGSSERNLWRILQVLRSMAPLVVLEDEADQSEQSRDEYVGDSGVSNRMRQMRFQFTSDPTLRGRVLWVRITNRPDKLDLADKRSGRSSERIPLCLPDAGEKADIFAVMPHRHGFRSGLGDFREVVSQLTSRHGDAISGADIEEISLRAYRHSRQAGRHSVDLGDYVWAIDDFIPLHQGALLLEMERMAVSECSSRRFLPARYRHGTRGGEGA